MIAIEGSHGTSVTRAQRVHASGFHLGRGMRGTGVYFWTGPYYVELAIGWYNYQRSLNRYNADGEPGCAIIIAAISVGDMEVLDLEAEELRDEIALTIKEQGLNTQNKREITELYDLFIKKIEQRLNITFKVVKVKVGIPTGFFPDYPMNMIGAPLCCVVRDTTCVAIKEIR